MVEIIFLTLAFYLLHWYLVNKTNISKKIKWINPLSFRYFWNAILLLSFLPTAISGILFYLGYGSRLLAYWHDQFGIVMVIVGVLHLLVRISYFVKY